MKTITIGNQQFTPAQARELLPDIVGYINHHGVMDDYTRRIGNRCDPTHVHEYRITGIGHEFDPPDGCFTINMFCPGCWKQEIFYVEFASGTWDALDDIAERSGLESTGLMKWASKPNPIEEFVMAMAGIFGDD